MPAWLEPGCSTGTCMMALPVRLRSRAGVWSSPAHILSISVLRHIEARLSSRTDPKPQVCDNTMANDAVADVDGTPTLSG